MRMLAIDEEARAQVKRVRDFADLETNWYRPFGPDKDSWIPGDRPEYTCYLSTYRCVYTITRQSNRLFRHLSISIPGGKFPNKFPNPIAAFTIADMFGFTGYDILTGELPSDWLLHVDKESPIQNLALAQPVKRHELPP